MTQKRDISIIYREDIWNFIPLINTGEEGITEDALTLKDFTLFKTNSNKRLNFEIFAIYSNKLYWFVEKDINFPDKNSNGNYQENINYGSHKTLQNYIYSLDKCEIVLENSLFKSEDFSMIMDINVNNDNFPEFIIFSEKNSTLFWIKKYIGYISGFGWDSNFWIYLMIYIYIVSSILGIYRFLILRNLKAESENKKFVKKK